MSAGERQDLADAEQIIGQHMEAAEQLLEAAYPLAMDSLTSSELAQIATAHALLAMAQCLMVVTLEEEKP